MKVIEGILFVFFLTLTMTGCVIKQPKSVPTIESTDSPEINCLADLAYKDGGDKTKCKVDIEENGKPVSYLVLTDNFENSGNCLLLRENLMDKDRIYNVKGTEYLSYYATSDIDKYLNGEFLATFSSEMQKQIADSIITIVDKSSFFNAGQVTTTILRKVFLLSYTEVNARKQLAIPTEGKTLEYFTNDSSRIVYYKNGTRGNWWLRSPDTGDIGLIQAIDKEGVTGPGGISGFGDGPNGEYTLGVRPAFCLSGTLHINKTEDNGVVLYHID